MQQVYSHDNISWINAGKALADICQKAAGGEVLKKENSELVVKLEQYKRLAKDMKVFLKSQIIKCIKRKLNVYLTPCNWNKFLMYEVCLTTSSSYSDLISELPKYTIPKDVKKYRGMDEQNMFIIESKDVFEAFFGHSVDDLKRKGKNGTRICFFLPLLIWYRPGMQKLMIGLKKAPTYSDGQIGRLVRYEMKKAGKK